MKKRIFIIPMLMCFFSFVSCYEDDSTLATENIGDITFTETTENLYVGSMEEITLAPDMQIAQGTNTEALAYEWKLTETSNFVSTTYDFEFETIGTDATLNYTVERPVSTSPYTLLLTVTDTAHGNLQYSKSWKVYVQSSFLDGILISDTKDGLTSDFTLINNKRFTLNYDKDEHIFRNILESVNGVPYNGLMRKIFYSPYGYNTTIETNQVWTISDEGKLTRFDCEDFTQNGTFDDNLIVIDKGSNLQVYSMFYAYSYLYMYTSNGFYSLLSSNNNRFTSALAAMASYTPDNGVVANSPNQGYTFNWLSAASYQNLTFYDKSQASFISINNGGQYMTLSGFEANNSFDPNSIPNQSAIAAVVFEDMSQIVFLMKDDSNGSYYIYTMSRTIDADGYYDNETYDFIETTPGQNASAINKYAVSAEGKQLLDKAVSVFFSNRNQVLYVATNDAIYTINYGAGASTSVSSTAKYTAPAGETITQVKMYQQGIYNYNLDLIIGDDASVEQTEWNNKALMIVTQADEYKGKVRIVPISQVVDGTLDTSQTVTYDGFGKILDVTTTGY